MGFTTPAGRIPFSLGIPSSASVYVFFFFFLSICGFRLLLVTSFDGVLPPAAAGFFFTTPSESERFGAAYLFFTVLVLEGAIVVMWVRARALSFAELGLGGAGGVGGGLALGGMRLGCW